MMKLTPEWRAILAKAWSMRLILLSGFLSGLEAAMPMLAPDVPSGAFAKAAAAVALAAAIARVVAQKDMEAKAK